MDLDHKLFPPNLIRLAHSCPADSKSKKKAFWSISSLSSNRCADRQRFKQSEVEKVDRLSVTTVKVSHVQHAHSASLGFSMIRLIRWWVDFQNRS